VTLQLSSGRRPQWLQVAGCRSIVRVGDAGSPQQALLSSTPSGSEGWCHRASVPGWCTSTAAYQAQQVGADHRQKHIGCLRHKGQSATQSAAPAQLWGGG
jgi:hypothetical protein